MYNSAGELVFMGATEVLTLTDFRVFIVLGVNGRAMGNPLGSQNTWRDVSSGADI